MNVSEIKDMNDENFSSNFNEPGIRVTRSRSKALGCHPLYPLKQDEKQGLGRDSKREAVSSSSSGMHKKRAVLKDVTNVTCNKLYINCRIAAKIPSKNKGKPPCFRLPKASNVRKQNKLEELKETVEELHEVSCTANAVSESESISLNKSSSSIITPKTFSNDFDLWMTLEKLEERGIYNIDQNSNNQLMCSPYAAEIYYNMYTKEVDQRPSADYMEKLQRDITKGMRGILIDWLVEVSEEYRLVPDTLYLTVNLIDRFLSKNYIEKQKLQLLGVTCMLIASKYEEICAPRVEEFCFITDSTYTKEEVVNMESRILNLLRFQLSVPTAKKFLRRFIQAAQVSYEVPSVEFEFLSNYLAELTLCEYSFLKFLPSLVAASAVFLAKWTLDQSKHPWNSTMEHYTRYKAKKLEPAVLEMQNLQLNTRKCTLNAIREKYKQDKFKGVSTLHCSKPVQSLFQSGT